MICHSTSTVRWHHRSSSMYTSTLTVLVFVAIVSLSLPASAALVGSDMGGASSGTSGSAGGTSVNNSPIRYQIQEELPAGTAIGNLIDDAGLRQRYGPEIVKQLRFRFVSAADAASLPFEIGAIGGALRTTGPIDRDSGIICNKQVASQQQQQQRPSSSGAGQGGGVSGTTVDDRCEVHLSIVVQPVQYLQIIRVIVDVSDINDNAPRFRETTVHVPINEASAVGTTYVLPTAIDADGRRYGVRRYELETAAAAAGRFGLETARKVDGSTDVRLVLVERLDRESESQYRLRLIAVDGGEPTRSGSVDLIITVTDSNDNRPEFTSSEYQATVAEDAPVGTVVVQVHAVDRDVGQNGEIEYSFAAQTQSLHGHLFGVRNTTGAVYVRGRLDHEVSSVYHLIVIGRDLGPDSVATEATVVVHVEDVNDNAPSIVASTLHQQQGPAGKGGDTMVPVLTSNGATVAVVPEDAPPKTFVAHLSVTDPDSGLNGRVNCSLITGTPTPGSASTAFALVRKYATEYQVVTATALDRERVSQYPLTVRCRDSGTEPRTTDLALVVNVLDVNDNSPVFSSQTYRGTLVENNYIGMSILQVTATDWDEGNNARIQYSIPGNMAVTFHVDQRGVVSAQDSVDRERYDAFRFPVLAVDQGRPPRTGSALVVIVVSDEDDEKPQFVDQQTPSLGGSGPAASGSGSIGLGSSSIVYRFNVTENEPAGTRIGTVMAEDRDGAPENNAFVYLFESGLSTTDEFAIDPHSGAIVTRKQLDRELQPVFRLTVMARPEANRNVRVGSGSGKDSKPIMSATTADVIVVVIDQNDNAPTVIFPSRTNRTVHVPARAENGYPVARIIARDPDFGDNGRLTYDIVSVTVTAAADEATLVDEVIRRRLLHYDDSNDPTDGVGGYASATTPSELFGIDADRGQLFVTRSLADFDLEQVVFDIHLSVVDNGTPSRRASPVDVASLTVVVNASMPYRGALVLKDPSNDDRIGNDDDDEDDQGRPGLLGMLTRRAGLVAYIATAVGIGCCLAVAAPIGASVFVRRRRRNRKRKETDDRLQESLRSMLAADGAVASSTSVCDVVKGTTQMTTMTSPETPNLTSPYHMRNGSTKSGYRGTADGGGTGAIVGDFNGVCGEVAPWSTRAAASSQFAAVGCSGGESGPERDSLHSAEGSSVTDSGRGPSEEGGGVSGPAGGPPTDCCIVVGNARSGGGIRCIPPPPPPASRAPFPAGQWCPPPTVLHHHHHHHHHQSFTGGGGGCSSVGSTTLPSRHHHHQQQEQQPPLRSALSTVSFSVRKKSPASSATGKQQSRQHHSNGDSSCATLSHSSTSTTTRTPTVRFRGLGSTLEEETDELLEACNSTTGATMSSLPDAVPGCSSTMPRMIRGNNGGGQVGTTTAPYDSVSSAAPGWSGNGSCSQRDHCSAIGGASADSATTAPTQPVHPNTTPPHHQQHPHHHHHHQQQQAVRTGRHGTGSVVSSCLHGSRSATVQPTAIVPTASKSFDV